MTSNHESYYHPPVRAFLAADDPEDAERLLAVLLTGETDTLIRGIVRRTLCGSAAAEVEDVRSEVLLLLIRRLRRLKAAGAPEPIADFPAYVATVAHHACYAYLRRQRPHWMRLRNQVRYIVSHDAELSVQQEGERSVCATQSADVTREHADIHRLPLRGLVRTVVRRAGGRMYVDDLVREIAELRGVQDAALISPGSSDAMERLADPQAPVTERLDDVAYLRRIWSEVQQLPLRQRWALLLNLRGERGEGMLALLPLTGIATIRHIADALQIPAGELAAMWTDLPLDDRRIAERLGVSRQQVINLRKSARARLARRLARAHASNRGGNTPWYSDFLLVRHKRPLKGAS